MFSLQDRKLTAI